MFDNCNSLSELNRRRQELVAGGTPLLEVNAAYNRAKKALMEAAPSFRTIPTFTAEPPEPTYYVPIPILPQQGNPNEIILTEEGVIL